LNFNNYQSSAKSTAFFPPQIAIQYLTLGLVGEAGEVAEKVKKHLRDNTPLDRDNLKKEFGDVLWYLALLADAMEIELDDVAQTNLDKLQSRKDRGVLSGSGDNR
jgi:NTP pyrophosphatase (non-canonical NTP hydrolase)